MALLVTHVDETVDRLSAEFDHRISRAHIAVFVDRCIHDLAGVPSAAIPELSERLARQRLMDEMRAELAPR
ncbi:MAG TPA: hypothetical protein VIW24_00450 [Aldersonia sp.]